ncbi:hypothetical protein COU75_01730 [Candidatus Peregrinibacteria bacterium CG10_big_fil_rev_8_21_14_0_10_42_8]|nr:MAG: hypothetical protein COU75_01730 [Candidatus Peregrinibacteria bacterium CG10_big_fil_rev_8_21_14_0_10_42_8]
MFNILASITGLFIVFSAVTPSAAAYAGVINDDRYGEHPYESRTRDENRRKQLKKDIENSPGYSFDNPAYYHPIYAQRSVLHPFFRKGGVSNYYEGRYAAWRGYQDPVRAHQLSPDTYCMNFTYQRLPYRAEPVNQHCF